MSSCINKQFKNAPPAALSTGQSDGSNSCSRVTLFRVKLRKRNQPRLALHKGVLLKVQVFHTEGWRDDTEPDDLSSVPETTQQERTESASHLLSHTGAMASISLPIPFPQSINYQSINQSIIHRCRKIELFKNNST